MASKDSISSMALSSDLTENGLGKHSKQQPSKAFNRSLRESTRSYSAAVAAGDKVKTSKTDTSKKTLDIPEREDKQQQEDKESKPTPQQAIKQLDNSLPFHSKLHDKDLDTIDERLSQMVLDTHSEEKKKFDSEKKKMLKSYHPQSTYEGKESGQIEVVEKELKRSEVLMPPVDLLKLTQDKDQQAEKEKLSNKLVAHIPTRLLTPIDVMKSKSSTSLNGMASVTTNGVPAGVPPSVGLAGSTGPAPAGTGARSRSRKKSRGEGRRASSRGRPAGRDKGFLPDHYKTEICRTHRLLGYCEYSENCQFAHGIEELRPRRYGVKYKTQLCKNYHLDGHCRFGSRCKFIHDEQRIQVGDREFWLISPSENLVRVEVVENTQRATQLKALIEAEARVDETGAPIPQTTSLVTPTATIPTVPGHPTSTHTASLTSIPASIPGPVDPTPLQVTAQHQTHLQQQQHAQQQHTQPQPPHRGSPQTITIPPTSGHVPISPQSPNLSLPETPFYTSTGYFQPATATSPSTGFPPAPSSGPPSTMPSPMTTPASPGFLYSNLNGGLTNGMGISPSGSVPHTPVSYYGFGNFSPNMSYSTLDYIQMAAMDPSTPSMMSPLSTASPSPSTTPLHMSPIVPLTRTLHQTFSLRRASSQPQSQQASPAAMLRGRTLPTMP